MKLDDFEMQLARQRKLTDFEAETAAMILSNRAACPIHYFPQRVVFFCAEVRELQQRAAKRFSTANDN